MSTINMADLPEEQQAAAPPPVTSTALVVQPSRTVAPYVKDADAEGELDRSDRVNAMMVVVAKTGELSNLFTPGDLLINKEFVIGGVKQPIEVTAIDFAKCYQNDLDFEGGEMGDIVRSSLEFTDRGGVLGYRPFEDKKSTHFWKPILQIMFLVRKPDGLPPSASSFFPFSFEGVDYGRVGFTARTKTAYNGVAKPLITAKQDTGSVNLVTYTLTTEGETWKGKSWIQPNLRAIGPTSEAMQAFLNTLH